MKKHAILYLLFMFILGFGYSQTLDDIEQSKFKKAHIIQETLMGYGVDEYGKEKEIGSKKSTRSFDDNGNLTSLIEYDEKSKPVSRSLFKYNDNKLTGGLVYKGFDQLKDKYKISYNKAGQKSKKTGLLEGNKYQITYTYDKDNNLTSKIKTSKEKGEIYSYNYIYNNAKLIEERYLSPKFSLTKYFDYNEKGLLVKEKSKTNNLEGYTFEYAYDSLDNKISEKKYTIDGLPYEWYEYTYSNKEIKTVSKYNFRGLLTYKWVYFYNDKNVLDKVKIYESEATDLIYITNYIYRYNKSTKHNK